MKKIVAAIDFSDVSGPVVEAGVKLSKALDENLHLVHVVEAEPTYAAYGFTPDEFPAMHQVQAESITRAEAKLKQMAAQVELADVQTKVLQGSTLDSILDYAREVDAEMLVLGSHGHGFLGSLLLGSVAEGCVRKALLPALIVPVEKK